MTEHAVNNGTSICQTAEATHLILPFQDFCAAKTVGFTFIGQRADLEFHLVNDPEPLEIQLLLYVRNISSRLWHVLTYEDPFNNDSDTAVKELSPNEDVYLYPIREFSFGNRDELIIYFRFDCDAEMLQSPEISQEQLEQLWWRLQSIRQDAAFADMTVNRLPAHRAVLAGGSGRLHETISKLVSNYQSRCEDPTTHDPAISNKSSEYNNVDTENDNTETIDGGHQNDDDLKHCNNENTVEIKTKNGDNEGNNKEEHQNQEDVEKITYNTKEFSEERNIQDSANSLNLKDEPEESTPGLKGDGNIMSGENSVNTAPSEVTENSALISDETVEKTKESRRTVDTKITQDVLSQLSEFIGKQPYEQFSVGEMCSMLHYFLTEHVVHKEIEILERPQPDNYKLELPELRNNESTEMFLEYIYTNSLDRYLINKIQSIEDLLAVARLLDLENLETNTELQIAQYSTQTIALRRKHLLMAKLYDLYTFKLYTFTLIRWSSDYYLESPLARCLLTMPSHHRYQKQCVLTLKVPNISKLKEHNSNVFCICGIPLQISVGRMNNGFNIKVTLQGENKGNMPLLFVKTELLISLKTFKIVCAQNITIGVRYRLLDWQRLIDPANGYIANDSIELRVSVMDYSWYLDLRDVTLTQRRGGHSHSHSYLPYLSA